MLMKGWCGVVEIGKVIAIRLFEMLKLFIRFQFVLLYVTWEALASA